MAMEPGKGTAEPKVVRITREEIIKLGSGIPYRWLLQEKGIDTDRVYYMQSDPMTGDVIVTQERSG